jgi:hypothetical protein
VVKKGAEKEANLLIHSLHHFQVQNSLLEEENKGLRESLGIKKKRKKHGRTMDLVQENKHNGGTVLWSPRKLDQACERQSQREQAEEHKGAQDQQCHIQEEDCRRKACSQKDSQRGEGEGEGKEGPRTGPKETTERGEITSFRGEENCAAI